MTPFTGAADQPGISTPALRSPPGGRKRSLADALADPRVRLGAGTGALLVTAIAVRRDRVGRCEAAAFRAVNASTEGTNRTAIVYAPRGGLVRSVHDIAQLPVGTLIVVFSSVPGTTSRTAGLEEDRPRDRY